MKRKILQGLGILGLFTVLVMVLGATWAWRSTEARLTTRFAVPEEEIQVVPSDAAVARGKHLAHASMTCADCHGSDLGGKSYQDIPGLLTVVGPNLTPGRGSVTAEFTDADWARVIAHGVRPDGTGVMMMPVQNFQSISGEDLTSLVAYLRSLAPVDRELPRSEVRAGGRLLWAAGVLSLLAAERVDHEALRPAKTPTEAVALGEYLAHLSGCIDCHGAGLSGGPIPGAPPDFPVPPNLTKHESGLAAWTKEDFVAAVRTGASIDGRRLNVFMPWAYYSGLDDLEVAALWAWLQTLPAREFGER